MINILIADDHAVVRQGIKKILSDASDIVVAGEASEWRGLFQIMREAAFDVLLLDISLPGRSGLDILREIKQMFPAVPVLILSMYEEEEYVVRAINDGASGYVSKSAVAEDLILAIRRVAAGGQYISGFLAERFIFDPKTGKAGNLHTCLSTRELEVLKKIAGGMSAKAIAAELSLSVKTVNAHREHILKKMNMRSNAELIKYAVTHTLV